MKHTYVLENFGVRLRPVRLDDAAAIISFRTSPHAKNFIGDTSTSVIAQEDWILKYFARPDDYCFMIELIHREGPVGTLGVYNIQGDQGEWGRWVIEPGIPAAAASAWLALTFCFEHLNLKIVHALIAARNREVLSFHRRIGYQYIGTSPEPRLIQGREVQMEEFQATLTDWPKISAILKTHAEFSEMLFTNANA